MARHLTPRLLLVLSVLALPFSGLIPVQAQAASSAASATAEARPRLVTIDAKGLAVADILKKIHEQTGFTVVIDDKFLATPLTLRLSRLDAEAAARRLAQKLALNNYALMVDAPGKIITLRPVGAPPPGKKTGLGEDAASLPAGLTDEEALAKNPEASVDPMDDVVIPPDEEGGKGMTRREYEAAMAAYQNADPMDDVVIPPDEEGGKGMTRREYEAAMAAAQNADPMDDVVIPPDEEGGTGMTRREYEAAMAAANQNADPMDDVVIPPDEEGGTGMTRREYEAAMAAANQNAGPMGEMPPLDEEGGTDMPTR
ncbi:hypothetical protein ASZ90_000057 [hydrocarbon metagenome]|uniref:Uncharacterized protein n=1 Tax=hydrocarbon metagenome TaxID=938273 RepID=A0A0W8GAA4_9ZZZZ